MYADFEKWLDSVLAGGLPDNSVGIGFNLYEDGGGMWSVQLIASDYFDEDDPDWMCSEVFTTGENIFTWNEQTDWENALEKGISLVREYLEKGKFSNMLKRFSGVGIGFVDGDIELVYQANK